MDRFWREFQQFHNCKFPKIIKQILNFCDINKSTFDAINENIIKEIETIVNDNKSILKGSVYDNLDDNAKNFEFSFGHRVLLLSLPLKYKLFREELNKQKKERKKRSIEIESETNTETFNPEKIRGLLITRINDYAKNHGLNYEINEK